MEGFFYDQATLMLRINIEDICIIKGALTPNGDGIIVTHPVLSSIHVDKNRFHKFTDSFTTQCGSNQTRSDLLDSHVKELMSTLSTEENTKAFKVPVTETTYLFPHITCNNLAFNYRQPEYFKLKVKFSMTNNSAKPEDTLAGIIPEIEHLETAGAMGSVADGSRTEEIAHQLYEKLGEVVLSTDMCVYAVFEMRVDSEATQQRHTADDDAVTNVANHLKMFKLG